MKRFDRCRSIPVAVLVAACALAAAGDAKATSCGSGTYPFPYTDVAGVGDAFCPGIMEAYVLGVTRGTTATTFSPNQDVPRLQMTTFVQRSIDQVLRRSSRRAALGQWWTPKESTGLGRTTLPSPGTAAFCKSDGERIWIGDGNRVVSVAASTGEVLANTGNLSDVAGVLVANGSVYGTEANAGRFVQLKSRLESPYWTNTLQSVSLGTQPNNLSFDGDRIWTANYSNGSIGIISLIDGSFASSAIVGGFTSPIDLVYDGTNMWVAEAGASRIRKLDANGAVLQTVAVGANPAYMTYDGANIWVPNHDANSITVVQASTGAIVATIGANGANRLSGPLQAAFDGDRILVTNLTNDSVTLFRAADLSLIGNVQLAAGSTPFGACSDGINFWVTLRGPNQLLRL